MNYLIKHWDKVLTYTLQHLEIIVLSFAIAVIIAIPIGLLVARKSALKVPVVSLFNIIFAIPSLVLYTLLISVTGLGMASAIIALVLYSQFYLVKNVAEGFLSVDPAVIEAGKGMGFSSFQLFTKIELPLAMPIILSGMRLTATSIATMAVMAYVVGAGGMGTLLFEGLRQSAWEKIIIGALISSLIVVGFNLIFSRLEKRSQRIATGDVG